MSKSSFGSYKNDRKDKEMMQLLKAAKQDQMGATNDRTAEQILLRYPTDSHPLVQSTNQKGTTMDDRLTIKTTLLRTKESTIATLPETEGKGPVSYTHLTLPTTAYV